MAAFCRDCLVDFPGIPSGRERCGACGSPRLIAHQELHELSFAHIDCDSFYASVEKRDNPDLADKPVIVGGGRRGVVSAACYVARTFGVKSAMPMFKALKACPQAVVIRPDMEKYAAVSRQIRQLMRDATPLVEPLSLDEAFLDLGGTERLHKHSPAKTLSKITKQIQNDIGVTASIGLSYNKSLAKVASDLDKPNGFAIIGRAEAVEFLSRQPVSLIWGAGKAFQKTLAKDGITHIHQLQKLSQEDLMRRYGSMGQRLYGFCRGEDNRRVNPRAPVKSVSGETTFNEDLNNLEALSRILWQQCERVSRRMKAQHLAGSTITLKLRSSDFRLRTRSISIGDPTQLADRIFRHARELLVREVDGTRYRLLGVGVSNLTEEDRADPFDLADPAAGRRADAERAVDKLREKFGQQSVSKGRALG